MRKTAWAALWAAILTLTLNAANAQQLIRGEKISDFHSLNVSGKVTVELVKAAENAVTIELSGTDPTRLEWGVQSGVLNLKLRPTPGGQGSAKVKLAYRDLDAIKANGGDLMFVDTLSARMLTIDLSGGAKFSATIDAVDLEMKVAGNSVAELKGKCKYLSLSGSMKSKINAAGMEAMSADVQSYTTAEVYVRATERLIAATNTGSSLFYTGSPAIVRKTTSLGGDINSY